MCSTSFRKRKIPRPERLRRAHQRRGVVRSFGRQAEGARRRHRMGRTGPSSGRWDARDRHELLRPVASMSSRAVTSLTNPIVKVVRGLHLRKARDEAGLFAAEGLKAVVEGIETGHIPRILMHG